MSHIARQAALAAADATFSSAEAPKTRDLALNATAIEITRFVKSGGPLTKKIFLTDTGAVKSDGSACLMSEGMAQRAAVRNVHDLAKIIDELSSDEAISLGTMVAGLPDAANVTTRGRLAGTPAGTIARTADYITFRPGKPAFALLDYDTKGMPQEIADRITALGGFWPAMVSVARELRNVARVARLSTSAGLSHSDTGERVPGSTGMHIYLHVTNGEDINGLLDNLHARCWLAGFGWHMIGAGGQLLDRSLIDRMVGAPERLVFEGKPILTAPLVQDDEARKPVPYDGEPLDIQAMVPPLTVFEKAKIKEIKDRSERRLRPQADKARDSHIADRAKQIAETQGISRKEAERVVKRQCEGVLRPDFILAFDDEELSGATVSDVLADPDRYVGRTLADPLEGIEYGPCKAKIMRRADGTTWINSFAHGRTTYELQHSAMTVAATLAGAEPAGIVETFVGLALSADLSPEEAMSLCDQVAAKGGVGKRLVNSSLKAAQKNQTKERAREQQAARAADAPAPDAPWLPVMSILNEALGSVTDPEPPMRDREGFVTQVTVRSVPNTHALSSTETNKTGAAETRLPPPEMPLLTRLSEPQLAEMIERHIDFVDDGRSVHLHEAFVKHFHRRDDGALPTVSAIATTPMVMPNGEILFGRGLDRKRGIVFRVPTEMQAQLPDPADCTADATVNAMGFLTDEWLADVAADYAGKCVLIAATLTILERHLLPQRPAFFITAGQRGGGKTTTVNMISLAAIGKPAAAAAWSPSDEERRKALLAYLRDGTPCIAWDNIPRGITISCPSIEKALTAETYSDRVLGASGTETVPATAVQMFTGNNIAPRGDMVSRSLVTRLEVNRPDPENRAFKHADPMAWTEAHRGRILAALYTVLLGNPRMQGADDRPEETRFKMWWHIVGSAVEHAAKQHRDRVNAFAIAMGVDADAVGAPKEISFKEMFLAGEGDDEQTSNLATVLGVIRSHWPNGATANDIAAFSGLASDAANDFRSALEMASTAAIKTATPKIIAARLRAIEGSPVEMGGGVWMLNRVKGHNADTYKVKAA
jgi:hypothetical protein